MERSEHRETTSRRSKDVLIRQRILRSAATSYVGRIVTMVTWLLLTPFLLHQLGPSQYGLWVLIGSVVGYGALLDLGLGGAIVKYVAQHSARGERSQAEQTVATTLSLHIGMGVITLVLGLLLAAVFPMVFAVPPEDSETSRWVVVIMSATVAVWLPCTTAQAVLRGLQRYDLSNVVDTVGALISAAATVGVLLVGGGLPGMVAVNVPITLLMQLLALRLLRHEMPEFRFGWKGADLTVARKVLSFSWSVFVARVANMVQTRTDEVVIGLFLPISSIAPYSVARKLAEAAQMLTDQLIKTLLPLASELDAERDDVRLRALFLTGTRLTLAIFIPIGGTLMLLAGPILGAWIGADYAQYGHLVVVLGVACLIATSQWPVSTILQGMNRHRPLSAIAIGAAIANLSLSVVLVGPFGLTGVAFGTLIPTVATSFGLVVPYAIRMVGVTFIDLCRQVVLPVLLPAGPAAALILGLGHLGKLDSLPILVVTAVSGILVYGLGYLIVGASPFERDAYRQLLTGAWRVVRYPRSVLS